MSVIRVVPPVIAKAGEDFGRRGGDLAEAVGQFVAASTIPDSAIGSIGPGEDALKAYNELLGHVVEHLRNLHKTVSIAGHNLQVTAQNYEIMERNNTLPSA